MNTTVSDGFRHPLAAQIPTASFDGDGWYINFGFGAVTQFGVHVGEDWAADNGSAVGRPVFAASNGRVVAVGSDSIGGTYVIIEHDLPQPVTVNGITTSIITTFYADLEENGNHLVDVGDIVAKGQQIGTIGFYSGEEPHLHFEVRLGDLFAFGGTSGSIGGATVPPVLANPTFFITDFGFIESTEPTQGNDNIVGTTGDDEIDALGGNDSVSGLEGRDTLIGGAGDDTLRGDGGNDQLFSGFGDDRADGGDGADLIRTGPGKDTLLGGADNDTLGASNRSDLLRGGDGDDLMLGSNGNDRLFGDGGNDTLLGGNGRDTLEGGTGADRLVGGNSGGADVASYANAGAGVQVRLWNGDGTAGDALGDTLLEIENLAGSAFNDSLAGDAGGNRIDGNGGDDIIQGLDGDDQLIGDRGDDLLIGGAGNDTFLYFAGDNADVIADFEAGAGSDDAIRLFNLGPAFDTFAEVLAATSDVGGDAVIDFGGGDQITLQGVTTANLHQDDFVFG